MLDFKSQADTLDIAKFLINVARTALFCSKLETVEPAKTLNLLVSSRYPQEIISLANPKDKLAQLQPVPGANWLWRGSYFFQEVAIVVCRDLPVEPKYYEWLIFAPVNSENWKRFVKAILAENRQELIEELLALRPKEFKAMAIDYLKELDPAERERINKELVNVVGEELKRYLEESPETFKAAISHINQEKLASTIIELMTPEKFATTLTPEQKETLRKILEADISNERLSKAG